MKNRRRREVVLLQLSWNTFFRFTVFVFSSFLFFSTIKFCPFHGGFRMEGGGSRNDEDPTQSNRSSYYDIIQEHESGTAYRDLISSKSGNNKSRKSFNDRLRLSRSSSTRLSPSRPVPASDVTFGSHRIQPSSAYPGDDYVVDCDGDVCVTRSRFQSSSRRQSGRVVVEDPEDDAPNRSGSGGRFSRSTSVAVTRESEEDEEEEEEEAKEEEAQVAPAKVMSLMDLLEETDRQAGVVGATYYSYEEEEEEEEEEVEEGEGVVEHVCCVCMVRHKGAAFVPCGHTFCRLCSRELWVSRGNCPLCNGYIMEILDIF